MTRHLLIFAACFLVAAAVTTAVRARLHRPFAPATPASAPATEAAPLTSTTGANTTGAMSTESPMKSGHDHGTPPTPSATAPVNTICAICGMPVNAKLPTAIYQGQVIGFGCKACPAKFAAEPERYGPAALKNVVVEE